MTALNPAREAMPAEPESKPGEMMNAPDAPIAESKPSQGMASVYIVETLREFLAKAAWSLGTRAQVLQHFADLGDAPGCHYVSRQITAEAKAIASVVTMLLIAEHEREDEKQRSASPTQGRDV